MSTTLDGYFRGQLGTRRRRIQDALAAGFETGRLSNLLGEVDQALARIDDGSFGICETCHEPIEADRLVANPLLRLCLDDLTKPEQRALESDLEMAARIQRGLLPSPLFETGGWEVASHFEPAAVVSGDYLDVVPSARPGGGGLFVLGDVAGKGVAAGMVMAHLRAILRGLAATPVSLPDLVAAANSLFLDSTLAPFIATLACARAAADGGLEIVNAGHCPPLLVRPSGIEEVETTGLPLGISGTVPYGSRTVRLDPGDSLVLYSDGISEALDRSENQYGEERLFGTLRLAAALPASEMMAALLEDLAAFLEGAPRSDDRTLLVVRRKG